MEMKMGRWLASMVQMIAHRVILMMVCLQTVKARRVGNDLEESADHLQINVGNDCKYYSSQIRYLLEFGQRNNQPAAPAPRLEETGRPASDPSATHVQRELSPRTRNLAAGLQGLRCCRQMQKFELMIAQPSSWQSSQPAFSPSRRL